MRRPFKESRHQAGRLGLLIAAIFLVGEAGAQGNANSTEAAAPAKPMAEPSLYPDLLGGTLSADGDLAEDNEPHSGHFRRPTALDPWFAWKARIREETGLSFGGSWMMLWQSYSSSAINQNNSVGSKLTLNFSYDLVNRGRPDALTFDMAVEDRRPVGTDLAPLQAGLGAGSLVPTAATYGDFSMGITQAYVRQNLFNNKFQYTVGKIFAPNFIDAYPFFDDNRQFLSQAFSTSPTIAAPLRGFGAVAAWYPTETGLYIKPGMFTTHSDDTGSTISDFFNKNEHFYMLEFGWSGLARTGTPIQARAALDADNVHLTTWYREPQEGGLGRSKGVAFNANQTFGGNMMWFLRAGWSEGWFVDRAAAVGLGWRPFQQYSDLVGAAIGWARPTDQRLRDQSTVEVFYRYHVTPNFAVTTDVQLQQHPALNPAKDSLWVFSLRGRMVF